jgi:hypothetical protein
MRRLYSRTKKIRRFVLVFLFLVAVNSFGIGWWWLHDATLTTTTTITSYSQSHNSVVHVPHPLHHIEENRKLHNELLLRIQNIAKQPLRSSSSEYDRKDPEDDEIDNRHHKELEAGDKLKMKGNQNKNNRNNNNKIDWGHLKEEEELPTTEESHRQSFLNCSAFGGPYDYDSVEEMVYWKNIPEDLEYRSKFKFSSDKSNKKESDDDDDDNDNDDDKQRFLTFDTDLSGFNNQRMVFEINLVTSIITGRILVLPRDRAVDHILDNNKKTNSNNNNGRFAMDDFFDLKSIASQMPEILQLMTIDEFVAQEGTPNKLNIPSNFTGFYQRTKSRRTRHDDDNNNGKKTTKYTIDTNGTNYHDTFLLERFTEIKCNIHKLGVDKCSHYLDWIDDRGIVYDSDGHSFYRYWLDEYLSDHPLIANPHWGTSVCLLTIPNKTTDHTHTRNGNNNTDAERFTSWTQTETNNNNNANGNQNKNQSKNVWGLRKQYVGHPVPVTASPPERLHEVRGSRFGLGVYDADMHAHRYHHMGDRVDRHERLLGHWYDYVFFEDWKEDLWAKRFVRDQLRYMDWLQCTAARIVSVLKQNEQLAGGIGSGGGIGKRMEHDADNNANEKPTKKGIFHAMHIRRTDLTKMYNKFGVDKNATDIFHMVTIEHKIIPKDSVVYIATDEHDKSFFDVFKDHYRAVYFLDDFRDLLGDDFPTEYYGMIDQLVCSRSEHFVGTYYSTFTGYINRLRGYHSQKRTPKPTQTQTMPNSNSKSSKQAEASAASEEREKLIREQGVIPSWFYAPTNKIDVYQRYEPIGQTSFEMEYASAWRNIDYDVDPILREAIDKDAAIDTETVSINEKKVAEGMGVATGGSSSNNTDHHHSIS